MEDLVEFFFGGGGAAEIEGGVIMDFQPAVAAFDPELGGTFLPLLFKASARELYFARKVCQPDDATYAVMKTAAAQAARDLALQYAKSQHANESTEQWPEPRGFLAEQILKSADGRVPVDAIERYRREVAERGRAFQSACQGMMTRAIDNRLTLLPSQYEPLQQVVAKDWQPQQYKNSMIFLYDEYLQLPALDTLKSALNDRQAQLLERANNHGRIHFGWEQDLGLQSFNDNGQELPGLEDLSTVKVDPPTEQQPTPDAPVTPGVGGDAAEARPPVDAIPAAEVR